MTGAEGYQGFFNLGKLGETSGIRFQGFYSRDSAETAGSLPESIFEESADSNLSAGDYEKLWAFQGSVQAYKQFGLGRASATVYFRRHRAERFNANQQDDPDAFGISYNTSFGYTADYRWTTVINDRTALSLRGGVDGEVTRVNIDIFADSTKFGGDARSDHPGAEPALGHRALRRGRPHHRQGDAVGRARDTTTCGSRSRTCSTRRSTPSAPTSASIRASAPASRSRPAARSSPPGARRSARRP